MELVKVIKDFIYLSRSCHLNFHAVLMHFLQALTVRDALCITFCPHMAVLGVIILPIVLLLDKFFSNGEELHHRGLPVAVFDD